MNQAENQCRVFLLFLNMTDGMNGNVVSENASLYLQIGYLNVFSPNSHDI